MGWADYFFYAILALTAIGITDLVWNEVDKR